ncbi:MAG: pyridoxal-dependent decarboxylase, partial [Flavobacteriaceae bacterium]|nr:pyridoxal-dependent decarboxylase [Flavobacteriaceae bacterium]
YEPESNILCFRYTKYHKESNPYQLAIRNQLVKEGNFYITSTELDGIRYLRIVVLNELTSTETIINLLEEISKIGENLHANF